MTFLFKSELSSSKKACSTLFNESPLKMMKNAFYFILKAPLVQILPCSFGYVGNSSIKKLRLISKFMNLQPGKQTIVIHILPQICRSKGNQTMKFGQLIEYNLRNIFI